MSEDIRINKYLASAGLADSRRKADEMIKAGLVLVNGNRITELSTKLGADDIVEIAGVKGEIRRNIYIALNKPRGVVCSHVNQDNNPTIFDILPKAFYNLKIAGRLDKESEGLVILSSDGDFIQSLSHPSNNKSKTYIVITKEQITQQSISALNAGIKLKDGMSKLKVSAINNNTVRVILSEGKNRQIRRSFAGAQLEVIKLQRVKIGNYTNPRLQPRKFVFIKPEDVL